MRYHLSNAKRSRFPLDMDVFVVLECEIFLPNGATMTYFDKSVGLFVI